MEVINALGRRKTSVARVSLLKGKGKITVNKKDYKEVFPVDTLQTKINQPFSITDTKGKFDVKVIVNGGGINGQAEAIRLSISRALIKHNLKELGLDKIEDPYTINNNDDDDDTKERKTLGIKFKSLLKAEGLLTRDSRMVERKKPGQPKARKKFQFSKR
tara:strand:- start:46 stop:525 length:480 start_codon:yes stop_codon:yes gene_type:complete